MAEPPDDRRRNGRWLRERAIALTVLGAFLLVFTWPFVRWPPLSLEASYVHLLVAWLAAVVVLGAMARAFGRSRPGREDDDA